MQIVISKLEIICMEHFEMSTNSECCLIHNTEISADDQTHICKQMLLKPDQNLIQIPSAGVNGVVFSTSGQICLDFGPSA